MFGEDATRDGLHTVNRWSRHPKMRPPIKWVTTNCAANALSAWYVHCALDDAGCHHNDQTSLHASCRTNGRRTREKGHPSDVATRGGDFRFHRRCNKHAGRGGGRDWWAIRQMMIPANFRCECREPIGDVWFACFTIAVFLSKLSTLFG